MQTRFTLLLGILFFQFQLTAQEKIKEVYANFPDHGIKMTEQVKNQVDSLYDKLKPGETVRMKLLLKKEKDLTKTQEINMSARRAQVLTYYALEKGLHENEFRAEIVHKDAGKSGVGATSNKTYRQFANAGVGISEFVLQKSNDYFKPYKFTGDSIGGMMQPLCQEFDPEKGAFVVCAEGSQITIDPNTLCYKNGDAIPAGKKAKICIKEFITLENITMNGLTTMSHEKILQTAGMFYIEVTSENIPLRMKNGKKYTIMIPSAEKPERNMKVFDGKQHHRQMNWNLNESGEVTPFIEGESTQDDNEDSMEGNLYIMKVTNFGWINCDKFLDDVKKTELIVSADTSKKVQFHLVYRDMKSVLAGYDYAPDKKVKFDNIPSGKPAVLVAVCVSKDKKEVMYAIQDVMPGKEKNIEVSLTRSGIADFEQKLKAALNP